MHGIITGGSALSFAGLVAALALANAAISVNGQKVTNLGAPTTGTDAATKAYVDGVGAAEVPSGRTLTAGAGLQGGGDLSANRSFNVNPDLALMSLALATTPAAAGDLRVSKTFALSARRADNAADVSLFLLDGADGLTIGSASLVSQISNVKTGGFHAFQVNSVESARVDSSQLLLTVSSLNFASGQVPVFGQAQLAGTGATVGATFTARAQQGQNQAGGAANNKGGIYQFGGGLPGTGGAGAAATTGDAQCLLGPLVGNASAKFSLIGTTSFLDFNQSSATNVNVTCNLSSLQFLIGSSSMLLASTVSITPSSSVVSIVANALTFGAAQTSVSITQAQHASAAGNTTLLRAQQGFGGFVGGKLQLGGGDGGTTGTNLGGDTQVLLGTIASNTSAKFSLCTGSAASPTSILDISRTGASAITATWSPTASNTLTDNVAGASGARFMAINGASKIAFNATGVVFNAVTTPIAPPASGGTTAGVITGLVALGLFAS